MNVLHLTPNRGKALVTPVIGYCGEVNLAALAVNHNEVADVFSVTIESLCKPENIKHTRFRASAGGSYTLPVFVGGQYRVWGLTAIILHLSLLNLAPGLYTFNKVSMTKRLTE
ncbi:hypothetical protein LSH36_486g04057 [Paralvinella palmiformis]|uniref:Uncharacterized protein n=1 Tax=Paralvinella palmiformis TaxID=53620 RepID=A0AAD9JA79_9ANNE|nr:hypothetical protein LSH36_486g04057 [Paralvinella palmiformis]